MIHDMCWNARHPRHASGRKALDIGIRANATRALQCYDHSKDKETKKIKRRILKLIGYTLFCHLLSFKDIEVFQRSISLDLSFC